MVREFSPHRILPYDFTTDPPNYKYNRSNYRYDSTQFRDSNLYREHDEMRPAPSKPQGRDISSTDVEKASDHVSGYAGGPAEYARYSMACVGRRKDGLVNIDDMGEVRDKTRG